MNGLSANVWVKYESHPDTASPKKKLYEGTKNGPERVGFKDRNVTLRKQGYFKGEIIKAISVLF